MINKHFHLNTSVLSSYSSDTYTYWIDLQQYICVVCFTLFAINFLVDCMILFV